MSVSFPLADLAGETGQLALLRRDDGQVGGELGGQGSPLSHAQHRQFLVLGVVLGPLQRLFAIISTLTKNLTTSENVQHFFQAMIFLYYDIFVWGSI